MARTVRDTIEDQLDFYRAKCLIHLARAVALQTVGENADAATLDRYKRRLAELLPLQSLSDTEARMSEDITKRGLASLKTDFELYVYKVAWALTYFGSSHVLELLSKSPNRSPTKEFPLVEGLVIAASKMPGDEAAGLVLADALVSDLSLDRTKSYLESVFKLSFGKAPSPARHQVQLAFEVRHKIEHRNGYVDSKFVQATRKYIDRTSWADRKDVVSAVGAKIPIASVDLVATYESMKELVEWLHDESPRVLRRPV